MADRSEPFTKMATRISHNAADGFGGAAVILAPDGELIDFFTLSTDGSIAQFYSGVMGLIKDRLNKIEEKERVASTFGRR